MHMDSDWETKLLAASKRESEEQEKYFLSLLDQASGNIDFNTAKTLMKTYTSNPDYGTQERVESVLETGEKKLVLQAILEEMPRLVIEAPEWAEALLGQEVEHRVFLVKEMLGLMSPQVKDAVNKVAESKAFVSFYPNAELLHE